MKARRTKPGTKSRGKRKARPAKGRAKRSAAQRPRSKTKKAKSRKRAGRAAGVLFRRKSAKEAAVKSGATGKSRAAKSPPARAGAKSVAGSPIKTVTRGNGRAAIRVRAVALPRPSNGAAGTRRRGTRPDTRLRTVVKRRRAVPGITVKAPKAPRVDEVLSPAALAFLAELHRKFDPQRKALLAVRAERQKRFDAGELPDFLSETKEIRDSEWQVAPIPADLQDRRVEITGPVDRKMIVNALNSGATHYMADFEDANSPTWANNIEGQINLKDRWAGQDRLYRSGERQALRGRPKSRGADRASARLASDRSASVRSTASRSPARCSISACISSTTPRRRLRQAPGLISICPSSRATTRRGCGTRCSCSRRSKLGIPQGTIKATVLIETLPAAFEMDEILWEMRDHIVGMNAGRWDYIFSFIKTFAKNPNYILPDRSQVVMGEAFLGAYAALLVRTCHRRGAFAMGGMAAQIPIKNDRQGERGRALPRCAPTRSARCATAMTAPGWRIPIWCRWRKEVFDRLMPQPNQVEPCAPACARAARRLAEDPRRHQDRGRLPPQYPRRRAIYRSLAARARRGADLQSDGRCRDRRDLPRADLAVDQIRREARERRDGHARFLRARACARRCSKSKRKSARTSTPKAALRKRSSCSARFR